MSKQIEERQGLVEELLERAMGPEAAGDSSDDLGEPTGIKDPLGTLLSFKNGAKYRRLRDGDTTGYDSNSEADMAYASGLSWVVGNDPDAVEKLMRQSGLLRAKWDEHPTYLRDTILKAIASHQGDFYARAGKLTCGKNRNNAEPVTEGLGGWFDLGDVVHGAIKKIEQAVGWLVYMAHVHLIHSKPGAGKTLLAVWLAIQGLKKDLKVMYFDAENGPLLMGSRFKAMGHTDFQNLRYNASPEITLEDAQIGRFLHDVDDFGPDIVFFDSLADFLAMCGLNENDAGDVTKWFTEIVKPLRDRSIAVVILDHEPWESRGHARGSTAKFAKVDVEWELKQTKPFDAKKVGEITLTLKKDRPAQLEHRSLKFDVGGPDLKFERQGEASDESITLATESVRHTVEAIKHFGEAGATDKEWKAKTDELGTRSTKYYEAKRSLLGRGRVIKTNNGRFVWAELIERTPPEQGGVTPENNSAGASGVDPDQHEQFSSGTGKSNSAGVKTELTRSTVDTTPLRSGGFITPERSGVINRSVFRVKRLTQPAPRG